MSEDDKVYFVDSSILFLRVLTTFLKYKRYSHDSSLYQDMNEIDDFMMRIYAFEITNGERFALLTPFKEFILLNQKTIMDRYKDNHWETVICNTKLHFSFKNVLQNLNSMEKEVIELLVHKIGFTLGLELLPIMNSIIV